MSAGPPTTLGKYQIIREIARSNDIVYEAYDPVMNRRVALKELAVPHGSTPQSRDERIRRFLREAKAAGSLSHPNIVTIYEVGEEAGRHFIAMEYLDGRTLRNELDTSGFLKPERAVEIATAVLEGLEFSHRHGVVHRDIKPENVQLLSDGRIKLTDFGIARLVFEPNLTMDGQVFGTPSYMSPEQVIGKEIDARSDVFSVGVILYEMLSGQKPFRGDNVMAISYAITNKEPDFLPQVAPGLWAVTKRALEKTPSMRFDSAKQMEDELSRAMAQPAAYAPPPTPAYPTYPTGGFVPGPTPGTVQINPIGQVYQQPFNPSPNAPPAIFPPQQTGLPGHPFANLPVFVPPPRRPLLSPQQSAFARRVFVILGSMVVLAVLVIYGVRSLGQAIGRFAEEQDQQRLRVQLAEMNGKRPVVEQIAEYEKALAGPLTDAVGRGRVMRDLAILYERRGQELEAEPNLGEAERHYLRALELDPANPLFHTDLANVYAKAGMEANGVDERAFRLENSGMQWEEAARLAEPRSRDDAVKYRAAAARAYEAIARELRATGQMARAESYRARAIALAGP
ncbi:MAG: protein kinase [Fimbriimonadaceae bacterium]|nr:protein kinase [Fimbriimonadaceae bacterium]